MSRLRVRKALLMAALGSTAACDSSTDTSVEPSRCDAAVATSVRLPVGGTQRLETEAARCFRVESGGDYLVATQLAGRSAPVGRFAAQFGTPGPATAPPTGTELGLRLQDERSPSDALHDALRRREQALAPMAVAATRADRPGATALARTVPTLGSLSRFSVLRTLAEPAAYAAVEAVAAYVGAQVVVYVDTAAREAFSASQWDAFGRGFDDVLFPTATAAFGATSDLDGNGRTLVLFTPVVNALVTQLECAQLGYVNGFFFANDLTPGATGGNEGEIFYAYVPDPTGRWSCPHGAAEVRETIPPTFIHELQHMISWQQHVLSRRGPPEESWLNEGLSHMAEQLGADWYATRYPAPSGRANTSRLLPDSAYPYLRGNLTNATRWLELPSGHSLTRLSPTSAGTLGERGAAWLFLRWLATQRGAGAIRSLVQTDQIGAANIEAVLGRPLGVAMAEFAAALWTDSIAGQPRPTEVSRRMGDPALRALFFEFQQRDPARAAGTFPLMPLPLRGAQRRLFGLPSGGMALFDWTAAAGDVVNFRRPDNQPFGSALGAQVVLLRRSE